MVYVLCNSILPLEGREFEFEFEFESDADADADARVWI